jgi:TPR repeat protein
MQIMGRKSMATAAAFLLLAGAGAGSSLALAEAAQDAYSDAAKLGVKSGIEAWQAGDYAGAVRTWRPLADKGNADAQFNLGQAYKLGRGVPVDLRTAQSWYEKAAQQNHAQAQANLGLILYQNGEQQKALPWIRKAAEGGDPRAQYVLGTVLFNGDVSPKDWPRAYALMQRAAAQGLPQAAANLERMDQMIPLAQRQQGLALARDMEKRTPPRSVPAPGTVGRATVPPSNSAMQSTIAAPPPARSGPTRPGPVQAAPARPAAAGGWRVQLGAFSTAANAKRQWEALRAKVGGLGGLQPTLVAAGAVTRLQAGPLPSRAAADRICAGAKANGAACFPVAP